LKLSKKTLLVIAAGAFVIIAASLGMVSSQRVGEQNQLNKQLTLAQSRLRAVQLETLSTQQAELESQLGQATSQFEAVKALLAQPGGSVSASTILFDVARAHNLEVTEIASPGPTSDTLEGLACSVTSLTARVEGDVPNLVSFILKLNIHLTTGVVKSIAITIPEAASGEKASADIQLVVYTSQGG